MALVPLTAACLAIAAQAYQVPPPYLYAILVVEGGRVGEDVADTNGTRDFGPFQINSRSGPALSRYWDLPIDEALIHVRDDGCANALIAAAILKRSANEFGGDMTAAVGLYHSHSARLAEQYRARVLSVLSSLKIPSKSDRR